MRLLKHVKWLVFLTLLINAAAMLTPVINAGDSVTYAALSQHMVLSGDWMDLVLDGEDWLDKPHLPFWITALFFKIGGISASTYILPGFLFHLIGGYYTYRIARLFHKRETAWIALLIYASAYHLMYTSSEVKAETYLTGCIVAASYYWLRFDGVAKLKYLLLGALFTAMAVMTKGVFTLITITSGLVCMWLYRKQWNKLWSVKWLGALLLSLLFTAPELAALYLQFDAHPEKVLFGQTHVSGIRFFLWDSQFGRFFNTGPIQNHSGNPFYFVIAFLWAFLPWVAVFVAALYTSLRNFARVGTTERSRIVYLCGAFFVTFAMFSATSFQIDYYTVILYPFAAILCADYLADWLTGEPKGKALVVAQLVITLLLLVLAVALSVFVANATSIALVSVMGVATLVYVYRLRQQFKVGAVMLFPVLAINLVYAFLVTMSAHAYTTYSIPYNVNKLLAGDAGMPIRAFQMPMVARELGLYNKSPCANFTDENELPAAGSRYLLVVRDGQIASLRDRLGDYRLRFRGHWVVHKTGVLPAVLRLAKGVGPLEEISVLEVGSGV
jgi:4-amino-4-deoxy-L-arabinose transferase-like glycosyltransferase